MRKESIDASLVRAIAKGRGGVATLASLLPRQVLEPEGAVLGVLSVTLREGDDPPGTRDRLRWVHGAAAALPALRQAESIAEDDSLRRLAGTAITRISDEPD